MPRDDFVVCNAADPLEAPRSKSDARDDYAVLTGALAWLLPAIVATKVRVIEATGDDSADTP